MIDSDPQPAKWRARSMPNDAVALRFLAVAVLLTLTLIVTSAQVYTGAASFVPPAVFVVVTVLATQGLRWWYPKEVIGACNLVTLIRAAMIAFVAGLIVQPDVLAAHHWPIFGVVLVAFAMDGLDGWLARRTGMSTDFGARFDMEIDAAFGAILSLIVLRNGFVGPEVLVLGFARFAFWGASAVFPWLAAPLPDSLRRKVVCVIQIAALAFLISPIAPPALMSPVSLAATALLVWSFVMDIRTLARASR